MLVWLFGLRYVQSTTEPYRGMNGHIAGIKKPATDNSSGLIW